MVISSFQLYPVAYGVVEWHFKFHQEKALTPNLFINNQIYIILYIYYKPSLWPMTNSYHKNGYKHDGWISGSMYRPMNKKELIFDATCYFTCGHNLCLYDRWISGQNSFSFPLSSVLVHLLIRGISGSPPLCSQPVFFIICATFLFSSLFSVCVVTAVKEQTTLCLLDVYEFSLLYSGFNMWPFCCYDRVKEYICRYPP